MTHGQLLSHTHVPLWHYDIQNYFYDFDVAYFFQTMYCMPVFYIVLIVYHDMAVFEYVCINYT